MEKNQIYKAFQQERYQIEERLNRFKNEIGGGVFSGSWNDLTDKPFEEIEGFETEYQLDRSGEIEFSIDSKYIGANLYIEYPGDDKYVSQVYSLTIGSTELSSSFTITKAPWEMIIKSIDTNGDGIKYVFAVPTDSTGTVKFTIEETVKTLDDKYISDNIARKSDLENVSGVTSWNNLTDKPFYSSEGMTVRVPVVNGEFTFDLPGVTMEQECIVRYSGDEKYNHWEANLLDLASTGFIVVNKVSTSALVDIEVTDTGIHCTGRIVNGNTGETSVDATGTITVVVSDILVTLDDNYISDNIARKEWVEEQLRNGGSSTEVSWNDLTDKPFYEVTETEYEVTSVENYKIPLDSTNISGNTIGMGTLLEGRGIYKFTGKKIRVTIDDKEFIGIVTEQDGITEFNGGDFKWKYNLMVDSETITYSNLVYTQGGYLSFKVEVLEEQAITNVKTLDDKYISENIARTSQLPSKTSDLENDSNYVSKAELQNILNQITVTTAEDGTISLNIPTIS